MRFALNDLAHHLALGFFALFAVAFVWLPLSSAVNAPNADDFDILLAALIRFDDANSFSDKLASVFMRHGEHYVVFARLVAIAQAQTFGQLNFAILIVFGAIAPILTALLLAKVSDLPMCHGALAACLIALLPQYAESLAWASGGLQHLWVWPFILAAFACAQHGQVFLAIAFAASACVTQGNGILVFPLCSVCFISKRRWISAALFVLISIAAVFMHTGSATDAATLLAGDTPLISYLRYSLGMLGAPLALSYKSAIVAGAIVSIAAFALLLLRKSWQSPAVCCVVLTILVTAPINALARIRFGESYGFDQSRYTYPGLLLLASLVILAFRRIESTQTRIRLGTALALAISGWWVFQFKSYTTQFALRGEIMTQSLVRRAISDQGFEYPNQARALELVRTAEARGYYQPPAVLLSTYLSKVRPDKDEVVNIASKMAVKLEQNLLGQSYLLLSGYGFDRAHKQAPKSARIILRSGDQALDISTRIWDRPDVANSHPSASISSGFIAVIPRSLIVGHDWGVSLRLDYADRSVERQIQKLNLAELS